MQIRILKSDGAIEPYLHTKVLGSFHHALALVGCESLYAAEQMAEAVTFYLYRQVSHGTLNTDQIHQMVTDVLESTGYGHAAEALSDHRRTRKLKRRRIEVIADVEQNPQMTVSTQWDKTRIVYDLVAGGSMDRMLARAVASAVEEKILSMGVTRVRKSLVHQLVIADTESLMDAHRQLATVG
ncbi:MAG: hypothetical protein ACYSUT_09525 [Planctomycetota bacterium]|jgi:hypothetical protein